MPAFFVTEHEFLSTEIPNFTQFYNIRLLFAFCDHAHVWIIGLLIGAGTYFTGSGIFHCQFQETKIKDLCRSFMQFLSCHDILKSMNVSV